MHVRQNIFLDIARLLAPVLPAYAAFKALLQIFSEQVRWLKIKTYKNHIIVCGLSRNSFYLINELMD